MVRESAVAAPMRVAARVTPAFDACIKRQGQLSHNLVQRFAPEFCRQMSAGDRRIRCAKFDPVPATQFRGDFGEWGSLENESARRPCRLVGAHGPPARQQGFARLHRREVPLVQQHPRIRRNSDSLDQHGTLLHCHSEGTIGIAAHREDRPYVPDGRFT